MTHEQAVEMKASERYAAGDLSPAERDGFEEHFACCPRCMDEVWAMSAFAANARAVFGERSAAPRTREKAWWLAWLRPPVLAPSFAALACAAVIVYQNTAVIPSLTAPRSLHAAVILDGVTRAAAPTAPAGAPLRFQIALPPEAGGGLVRVDLSDRAGAVLSTGTVKSPSPDEPLDVYFPIELKPGRYTIVIRAGQPGRSGAELARSPFEVVAQEPKL